MYICPIKSKIAIEKMDKLSYALGLVIANNLKGLGVNSLVTADFSKAIDDILKGEQPEIGETEAQMLVQQFMEQQEAERGKFMREAGERYLADNAKREGVTVLPSGLQYEVLRSAIGRKPTATVTVELHYEGRLIDGTVFASSYKRGQTAPFGLNQAIKGWTEGVQLMAEGAKYRLFIPYNLAYGTHGAGQQIPPYAALVFDIELIKVK